MELKKFHTLVATFEAWNVNISEFITFLCSTPCVQNSLLVQDLYTNGAVISFTINMAFPFASAPVSDVAFQMSFDGFGLPQTWVVMEGGVSKQADV
jgi:hypothetical protein